MTVPTVRRSYRLTPDRRADMHTVSGVPVYLDDPWGTGILASDLRAHAAGGTRYNGAPPVTILQHSVLVAMLAEAAGEPREVVEHAAGHDLAEAIPLGEVVKGLKRKLPDYQRLEHAWEPRVRVAVGLSKDFPAEVKARVKVYDRRTLMVELWWHDHPIRYLHEDRHVSNRERWIAFLVFGPLVGCVPLLWRRLVRWLPRLKRSGPL